MGYKYVFFDFDGTLSDSKEGVIDGVIYTLSHYGISVEDREALVKYVGPPLIESFSEYFEDREEAERAVARFREYYRDKGVFQNEMFAGIDLLLKRLKDKGRILIVATSKLEKFAKMILQDFGIFEYFDFVAGHNEEKGLNSKEDVIKHAIKELEIDGISEAVMVGDRKYDIIGAKAVGMDSVGVLFGYGGREELEEYGATYIAETVEDIEKYV